MTTYDEWLFSYTRSSLISEFGRSRVVGAECKIDWVKHENMPMQYFREIILLHLKGTV